MPLTKDNNSADAPQELGLLTAEQRERLAASAADGQVTMAEALRTCTDRDFVNAIHKCRRRRLFHFIARSIAVDIHRERQQLPGDDHVAQKF